MSTVMSAKGPPVLREETAAEPDVRKPSKFKSFRCWARGIFVGRRSHCYLPHSVAGGADRSASVAHISLPSGARDLSRNDSSAFPNALPAVYKGAARCDKSLEVTRSVIEADTPDAAHIRRPGVKGLLFQKAFAAAAAKGEQGLYASRTPETRISDRQMVLPGPNARRADRFQENATTKKLRTPALPADLINHRMSAKAKCAHGEETFTKLERDSTPSEFGKSTWRWSYPPFVPPPIHDVGAIPDNGKRMSRRRALRSSHESHRSTSLYEARAHTFHVTALRLIRKSLLNLRRNSGRSNILSDPGVNSSAVLDPPLTISEQIVKAEFIGSTTSLEVPVHPHPGEMGLAAALQALEIRSVTPIVYPRQARIRPLRHLLLINQFLLDLQRIADREMRRQSGPPGRIDDDQVLADHAREDELKDETSITRLLLPQVLSIKYSGLPCSCGKISDAKGSPWPPPMPPLFVRRTNRQPSCLNPIRDCADARAATSSFSVQPCDRRLSADSDKLPVPTETAEPPTTTPLCVLPVVWRRAVLTSVSRPQSLSAESWPSCRSSRWQTPEIADCAPDCPLNKHARPEQAGLSAIDVPSRAARVRRRLWVKPHPQSGKWDM